MVTVRGNVSGQSRLTRLLFDSFRDYGSVLQRERISVVVVLEEGGELIEVQDCQILQLIGLKMKFAFPFLIFAAASVSVRGIRWIKRGSENNPSGFDQNRNQSEVIFGLEGLGQEESDAIEIPVDAKEEDFKLEKLRLPDTSDQIQTRQTLPGQGYPNQGFSNQGYPNPGNT